MSDIVNRLRFDFRDRDADEVEEMSQEITRLRADLAQRTAERDALAAEVADLKAEVSRISLRWEIADHRVSLLWAERDEARRWVCQILANPSLVTGLATPGEGSARDFAAERGWDCFDAKEGQL
jgi:hypothetical protein